MGAPDPFAARDAERDALRTERNAAVAEAKLWRSRMHREILARDQAKADLYECGKCLGEWQAAHDDLLMQFRRLEVKLGHQQWDADYWRDLARIYEPHAARDIQRMIDEAPE